TADGTEETLEANVLISAVGAFNTPAIPPIPGLDSFSGPVFHTARWPADVDVEGRRVAVIGNGASAMQVVPAIAGRVAALTVLARSPHWIAPFDKLHQPVPPPLRRLLDAVPLYRRWYRARLAWIFNDRAHPVPPRAARGRHRAGHRLRRHPVPVDVRDPRPFRRAIAGALAGRRRPGLPRHRDPRLPQLLRPIRPQHAAGARG